ncbi:MAG: acyl-CoA dehydrogenase family protein [Pseudomonadales bacterium]|nr:acyl-CoA dehydrogenase family protein [Pseudomonadales bacterium]MDG1443784.1 acyl-CoA dehydrogenase family protein [Pseudomonadales bacterium]
MSLESFREETRTWLEENCPASIRTPMPADEYPGGGRRASYKNPDTKVWMDRMSEKGFTVPTWPKEYGGAELNSDENRVLQEELRRISARPSLVGMGLSMIGPALLEYGTDEQKAEHLPKISSGQIWWCQGYSEPNSGSDLASLQTKAIVDGDDYIINGQKIWTSGADNADWIFCLVRTDFEAPKHNGITFILFDMTTPGVSVKPIKLISGLSPFCETFFEDVRASRKNVIGTVNDGWTVAKRLLQYERTMIGGIGGGGPKVKSLAEVADTYVGKQNGKLADLDLRDGILNHSMNDRAFGLTVRRTQEESKSTKAPSFVSSMFKLYGTEQNMAKYELMLKAMGSQMLGWQGDGYEADELTQTRAWLRSKANSIEGGTTEVQYNIIAKRVLGLPD